MKEGGDSMSGWLESVYTFFSQIYEFFMTAFDAIQSIGNTISNSYHILTDCVRMLPTPVIGAGLVCICIAVLFLVLGR